MSGKPRDPWVTVSEALDDLPDLGAGDVGEDPLHVTRNHRQSTVETYRDSDHGDTPHGGFSPRVLYPKRPSWTVTVSEGKTPIHHEQPRMLTPRELARLQTIPDWYTISSESRGEMCRLVGNAVPPDLAEAVVSELPQD